MNKKHVVLIFTSLVFLVGTSFSTNVYSRNITIDNNSLYSEDSLKKNANQAAKNGDYKKAAFLFEQLVKKIPNDDELRLKLAYVLFMNKDYKTSTIQFEYIQKNSKNSKYVSFAKKQLIEIASLSKASFKAMKTSSKVNKNEVVEINNLGKDNYLCNKNSSTILEDGSFMRWEKVELPIKVYIPPVPENLNVKNAEKYINIVKYSMQKWSEKAPKFISFKFIPNSSEANINITWQESFKDESTWGLASFPRYIKQLKKRESTIYLPVKAQAGTVFGSNESAFFSEDELSEIIVHETGHSLGLAHSYNERGNIDIMAPYVQNLLPGVRAEITERDINTLNMLYSFPEDAKCECKEAKQATENK